MRDEQPSLSAGDGLFPVLRQSAAPAEPGEGALDHPAPGEDFEPFSRVGAFDDLDGPASESSQGFPEFGPGIAAIGKE